MLIYCIYIDTFACMYIHYTSGLESRRRQESLFLVHRVWIWGDRLRDHNLPHHTRIVLPNVSTSHAVTHIWEHSLHCHLTSCSLLSWSFSAPMSSLGDCLRGNSGARLTPQDMTSPGREVHPFQQPGCERPGGFFRHCSCCGVRCWRVVGRGWPPVRLGAWALWL